jgi:hypothetical protein
MGSPRTSVEIREHKPDIEWIEKHIKGSQYSLSCIVDFTLNTELEIIKSLSGFPPVQDSESVLNALIIPSYNPL